MISLNTLATLGKAAITQVIGGKVTGSTILAETLWQPNHLTVLFVIRRPGTVHYDNIMNVLQLKYIIDNDYNLILPVFQYIL